MEGIRTEGRRDRLFIVALTAFTILLAGTLLYPDTYAKSGVDAGPFHVSLTPILFLLAALPVSLYALRQRHDLVPRALDLILLLLVGYMTIRGVVAATNGNELGLVIAYAAYALLLYYGAAALGQRSSTVRTIFFSLAVLGTVIAAYALLEFILNNNFIYGSLIEEKVPIKSADFHRSGSSLAHPIALGNFLVQVAPFAILFYLTSRTKGRRFLWGLAIMTMASGLLVTFSKGSWGSAVILSVAALAILLWRGKLDPRLKKNIIIIGVISGLAVVLLAALNYRNLEFNIFSENRRQESVDFRWQMWKETPESFILHPLFGVGMWQGGKQVLPLIFEPGEEIPADWASPVDNIYLSTIVEEGLIGSVLTGALLILIGMQTWKVIKNGRGLALVALPLAASMVSVLINGLTTDSLLIWPVMVVFWISAGLIRSQMELLTAGAGELIDVRA